MGFEIGDGLKIVWQELMRQIELDDNRNRYDFMELLRSRSAVEKYLLAKQFCKTSWNIGSLKVLGILQELRILTAREFVLSLQDAEQTQLILNDFFEGEYELLANLFTAVYYDSLNTIKLSTILDECLRRFFADLVQNPNLNEMQYLKTVKATLPNDLLLKLSQKHVSIVLELHSSNFKAAFQNFSTWINEGVDHIRFTKHLYETIFCHTAQDTLSYLLKLSTMEHFKEWKFYLILLQTIASNCAPECGAFMRKYLKTRLRQIAALPCKTAMLHLLLTTRAATATTMDIEKNIDAYASWYKQNIGEMKFVLKAEEFQNIVTLLVQCVEYEFEEDYLEVHSAISISPPVLCGKMVQGYKSKCKTRLSHLKRKPKASTPVQLDESILIEDSD